MSPGERWTELSTTADGSIPRSPRAFFKSRRSWGTGPTALDRRWPEPGKTFVWGQSSNLRKRLQCRTLPPRPDRPLRGSGLEVELREIQGRDTLRVLQQISELMDWGASGLAIASNNTPDLVQRINEISNQGVPVVTFNTDAPDSRRLCFVGMDNYRAGQTAAGLIRQMLPGGGLVLPIAGHVNNGAHINRLRGFLDTLEDTGDIQLLSFQPCFDRDDYAYEITQHALQETPSLACVYITSNGQRGVCQAIEDERKKGRVRVVAYDLNAPNRQLLRSGDLSFVLDQVAYEQGRQPLYILYNYLLNRKMPEGELLYTDTLIRTKYNIGE